MFIISASFDVEIMNMVKIFLFFSLSPLKKKQWRLGYRYEQSFTDLIDLEDHNLELGYVHLF